MSGTLGTSSIASVLRPAISAARYVEPIPKATVAALAESGRRISGRIGISLASTVSSGHRRAGHPELARVEVAPAWTAAISSSVASYDRAPPSRSGRARIDDRARADEPADDRGATTMAATAVASTPGATRSSPPRATRDEGDRRRHVDEREQRDGVRRADRGDHEERHREGGGDRARGVRREQPARVGCDPRRVVAEQRRRGREAEAHDDRRRQDDQHDRQGSSSPSPSASPGSIMSGRPITRTSPPIATTATTTWARRSARSAWRIRGRRA